MATFSELLRSLTSLNLSSSGNNAQNAVDAIKIVPVANAAAANVLTLANASMGQATRVTIPDPGQATATVSLITLSGYAPVSSIASITAGTVQSRTGATAVTTDIAYVTTANDNDGVVLPAIVTPGQKIQLINASAHGGVIYAAGSNTINGTAGVSGIILNSSKTVFLVAISSSAWVSTVSN